MTKTTERVVGLVAVIVGLAGYFIGIPSNLAESFGISSATLLVLSLGVLAFGLLLLLWRVWEEARALYERLKSPGSGSDLPRVRPAAWPDLPELHRLLVRFFGEEAPSFTQHAEMALSKSRHFSDCAQVECDYRRAKDRRRFQTCHLEKRCVVLFP